MEMMEEALNLWRQWNSDLGETVFHETGVLYLARTGMEPGGFECDSYELLLKRSHVVDRLNSADIAKRFPAWNSDVYVDGYFNPQGGWSPSGKVVNLLAKRAIQAGVKIIEGTSFASLIEEGGRVRGIKTADGTKYRGDHVIVCAGSWTPVLLPFMHEVMWPTAQPVLHFKAADIQSYQPPEFPVWTADVGNTGWYGFPAQDDGTLKLANHGPGWRKDPLGDRSMPPDVEPLFRAFFAESLPGLAAAPKIGERLCFYCDTFDGNFWIANDPERPGLLVSAGGSGHAFKFTPLIGKVTADVLEGKPNRYAARFAWRERGALQAEEARHAGEGVRK
jgi:sarcosine oxidase / L-pipecolate oxidase